MAGEPHRDAARERYPIFIDQDQTTGRWTAWLGMHEAPTEDELMTWLRANVPIEWTGVRIGWASPPARSPRRDG